MAETLTVRDVWTRYIQAAMQGAEYETIEDGTIFGHIPGFPGAWANGPTQEACASELAEVLYDWAVFRLGEGLSIPEIPGVATPTRAGT